MNSRRISTHLATLAIVVAVHGPGATASLADEAAPATVANDAPPTAEAAGTPTRVMDTPDYTVQCDIEPETNEQLCLVDRDTYVGWRTFHAFCHVCHAQDAMGSTFAPNLLPRIRQIDKAHYLDSMNNGFTGQVGVMPPWKDDPNVNKRFDELWSYLTARANGDLPPGRPKRIREE